LSLRGLQDLVDLSRVVPTQYIDLIQIMNGRDVTMPALKSNYGVQPFEEGTDIFQAKVNIEVQLASIATIEKMVVLLLQPFMTHEV
jgi:large subunit ribosomal protein L15